MNNTEREEARAILRQHEDVLEAMAAYASIVAKKEAIEFLGWADGKSFECTLHTDEDEKIWQRYGEGKTYTTEQLYYLKLNEK